MAVTIAISSDVAQPLSQENLPQTITLTGVGTDSGDSGASFNFSWHIIDKPPSSTATLSALVGSSVSLAADLWGSYRIFCIATNLATNESSTSNPLEAPLNSFFDIRVESTNKDLEKPSKSQRNWHPQYWKLVDVVEGLNSTPATFLASGDVEIATAAEIATVAGPTDSTSGNDFLAITTEQLSAVLQNNSANGNLTSAQTNVLRNHVKTAALEKMNEVSITELADVDTTTHTPVANDLLVWNPTATDDSGDNDTGAWVPKSAAELSLGGGGGTSAGNQYQIQIADASNGFAAANWSIDSGDDFIPGTNNAFDIGSTSNAVRDIYCDGNLYLGTSGLSVDSNVLKFQSTNSIPHFSGTPADNQILKYDSSAGGWQLEADVSAAGIDGLTSNGSNQLLIDAAYDLDPASTGVHLGSSSNRYGNVYALDGNFSDDVTIGDVAIIQGNAMFEDFATIQDDGAAGTLLIKAGENGQVSGHIDLTSDEVIVGATTASTAGKLSIVDSSGDKIILSTQTKQGVSHTMLLPPAGGAANSVMYASSVGTNETSLEFATIKQRVIYSTGGLTRTNTVSSFSGSNLSHPVDSQACIYFARNCTGNSIDLKQTHVMVGSMMNASLTMSLVKAANDSAALANTWTQLGSGFTVNNSSGSGGTLGQGQSKQTTSSTIANGEYVGVVITNIPNTGHADSMISVQFELEANVAFA